MIIVSSNHILEHAYWIIGTNVSIIGYIFCFLKTEDNGYLNIWNEIPVLNRNRTETVPNANTWYGTRTMNRAKKDSGSLILYRY